MDSASLFRFHVQRSLRAGTIRNNALTIDMLTDVFGFLFDGIVVSVWKGYKEYSLQDFDSTFFYDKWYVCYNEHDEGCAVDFHILMKSRLGWGKCEPRKMLER